MNRVFPVCNHKGGVGKSTVTANLGYELAELGHRVLLIDTDPQANLTSLLGLIPAHVERTLAEIYDERAYKNNITFKDLIVETKIPNVSVIPANIELSYCESKRTIGIDLALSNALLSVFDHFDYCLIDTPPSLGQFTLTALVAGTHILLPLQCEPLSTWGMTQLLDMYDRVHRNLNPRLQIGGAIINMYDSRLKQSARIESEIRSFFPITYKTVIKRSVKVSEAQAYALPVQAFAESHDVSQAFHALALEVIA
jgi:chromosome partitioning protein